MSSRRGLKREQILKIVESLGIDFHALNHHEQRVLVEKIAAIARSLDPPNRIEKLIDAVNAIYEFCGLPKVIALNILYDAARICSEAYPPIRNILRELSKRYKIVDRGCLETVTSALAFLELVC